MEKYELNFFTPLDINECATDTHNCDVSATCSNTVGSFECTCDPGYSGDGTIGNCLSECKQPWITVYSYRFTTDFCTLISARH